MSLVAGAEGPTANGVLAKSNEGWLKQHHELSMGAPSHDTIDRVLIAFVTGQS